MATQSGTAANYLDLLDRLVQFLVADPELVAASQNWSLLADRPETVDRVVYLQGPGLAGTDQIHVHVEAYKNPGADVFNWRVWGSTGFNPAADRLTQPGTPPAGPVMPLWNTAIPYWFVANGRRFFVIAKVSTVYEHCYAGFFLPHAAPSEYPYPLALGGSTTEPSARWSNVDPKHRAYWSPASSNNTSGLLLRKVGGDYQRIGNYNGDSPFDESANGSSFTWPYTSEMADQKPLFGTTNQYLLTPITMASSDSGGNTFGELDGLFFVSGFGSASENIVTVGGVDHLVVQNTFRTSRVNYVAARMA